MEVPPRFELPISCCPHRPVIAGLVRLLDPPDEFDFFARPGLSRDSHDAHETWEDVIDGMSQCVHFLNQRRARQIATMRSQLDELTGVPAARIMQQTSPPSPMALADPPAAPRSAPRDAKKRPFVPALQHSADDPGSHSSEASEAATAAAQEHAANRRRRKERKEDFADHQARLKTFKRARTLLRGKHPTSLP